MPAPDRKPAILIVEDDPLTRSALAGYLLRAGYEVHEAAGAEAGMAVLGARFVDLVFADVQIDGAMDGFELAQWIEINYPRLPVIMTSGVAPDRNYGVGPLIAKPYDFEYVRRRIADTLRAASD